MYYIIKFIHTLFENPEIIKFVFSALGIVVATGISLWIIKKGKIALGILIIGVIILIVIFK